MNDKHIFNIIAASQVRKLIAIVLLSTHLYTLGGYMVLFQYVIYQSNKFSEEQISKNLYKAADLVEIKIPVKIPRITNWNGYQRISGAVQLQANWYNYVKLKITRDTLYMMCVPNYKTTRLINANVIYAREISDAPLNTKRQATPLKSITLFKYLPTTPPVTTTPIIVTVKPKPALIKADEVALHPDVLGQPPELRLA